MRYSTVCCVCGHAPASKQQASADPIIPHRTGAACGMSRAQRKRANVLRTHRYQGRAIAIRAGRQSPKAAAAEAAARAGFAPDDEMKLAALLKVSE